MVRILARVVCIVALAGCTTTYRVDMDGFAMHKRIRDLRYTGKATVDASLVINGSSSVSEDKPYSEPITVGQTVTDRTGKTRWVRDLLRGCDDDETKAAANVDCELDKPMAYYATRSWETRSTTRFLQYTLGGAIAGVVVGAIACAEACPDDTAIHDVSKGAVIVGGVALAGILVWAIIDCAGKWGEPGCRD
jgi:hypothetical protein